MFWIPIETTTIYIIEGHESEAEESRIGSEEGGGGILDIPILETETM